MLTPDPASVGILMVLIPLFQCEIAPPAARGFLVSQHGLLIIFFNYREGQMTD